MANFVEELRSMILADSAIAAVISDRLYQISLPQNATYPACAYTVGLNEFYEGHGGKLNLAKALITLGCAGNTYADVLSLANAVKDLLHNFNGIIGGITVQDITYQDSRQTRDEELDICIIEMDFLAHIEP